MTSISIAIATFNRSGELRRTLEGLIGMKPVDSLEYEVLVIDNNSSDDTRAVVESFSGRFGGRLRYIWEGRQGLSRARNRAVEESRFDVVAFIDDDVDVDAFWLDRLAAACEGGDYDVVGGRALLSYPRPRPGWLGDRDEGFLTKVDHGPERRAATPDELYGVNLSIRKSSLLRVGGFRCDLGRMGDRLIGSEETELLGRVALAGGRLLYEPSAVVGHRVSPERLRRRWFWSRSYWGHRGEARMFPAWEISAYQLARRSWHVALAGGNATLAAVVHGLRSEEFFHQTLVLAARLGTWTGLAERLPSGRSSAV
ncbi:glycosyltransferase family 2 protein [Paludisphaera borealis]|uniref:GT2 family glycosyltransferase n=1 Tax=Paludisphaera borealis TaxID=1387353 RepID=A0A1U7CLT5_9BACT|nr:glycosyltransferase [Paludisphaera borealis]APW59900.1 GT2 family glycosyltransferase [Paludisphaera borealis]